MNSHVYSLTVFDNKLIAEGRFTMAGGIEANGIAAWDGSTCRPSRPGEFLCLCLTVYDNKLIAGGNFTTAGGAEANCIAAWTGLSGRHSVGMGDRAVVR